MQVTERRRELGLLRAVGATQRDVRMVVLGEAALIGLIGGLLGVLLGIGDRRRDRLRVGALPAAIPV